MAFAWPRRVLTGYDDCAEAAAEFEFVVGALADGDSVGRSPHAGRSQMRCDADAVLRWEVFSH